MKLVAGSRGNYRSTESILKALGGRVAEIFVSVSNSELGSGRNYVHEVSLEELKAQQELAAAFGAEISLAFNTVCFGARKLTPQFLDLFDSLLARLEAGGISKIILADPYLMRRARRLFPRLQVIVSVFCEVDSLNRLRYFEDLGASRIILPHELNRDLKKLELFRRSAACDLELILNLGCVHYCVRADSHSLFTGHNCGAMLGKKAADYYHVWCNAFRIRGKAEFLMQDWIRPEEVKLYESLGYEYFKLAGRATATTWIIRAAKAYLDGRYDGNIFDLIAPYFPFTDRLEVGPFSLDNRRLDDLMPRLLACGQKCWSCDFCRSAYGALKETGFQGSVSGAGSPWLPFGSVGSACGSAMRMEEPQPPGRIDIPWDQ